MNLLTEQNAIDMGFVFREKYTHDEYLTNRYQKGFLTLEFTYRGKQLLSVELTIEEVICRKVSLEEMQGIMPFFNKTSFDQL
nr:hypothetical protein [uncultured Draconibacterium sp.]